MVWTDNSSPYASAWPFLYIVNADVLRLNDRWKFLSLALWKVLFQIFAWLEPALDLLPHPRSALTLPVLSAVVPWHFLRRLLSCYFYNQSAACVRGFRFLWLSPVMQWQQGMQQQGNHMAGVGKETRRQNKSKFGLCSDKLRPASSDKILWAQMRDRPVFGAERCKIETRWLSLAGQG